MSFESPKLSISRDDRGGHTLLEKRETIIRLLLDPRKEGGRDSEYIVKGFRGNVVTVVTLKNLDVFIIRSRL